MTRLTAVVAGVALALAPASVEAKKRPAKRAKVVCFKKKGKKVCRKRRAVKRTTSVHKVAPALPIAPAPAAAAPAVTTDTVSTTTTTTVTPPPPDCGTSPWVGLTAEDVDGVFRFTGKRTCVPGPTIMVQLRNDDAQEHNLYAEGVAPAAPARAIIENVDPGDSVEAAATLSAGEWRLYCDIEGHGSMTRTLTVLG